MKLVATDPTFIIEVAYMECAEQLVQGKIEHHILSKLPEPTAWVSLSQCIVEMRGLKKLPIIMRASMAGVGLLDGILELLINMEKGVAPDPTFKSTGQFLNLVWQKLENFARYSQPVGAGSATDVARPDSFGRDAINDVFAELRARMAADPDKVGFGDLNELQRFKWLLSNEQMEALHGWTNAILDSMAKDGRAKLPLAPASSASKKKKGKEQQQPEDDKGRVMSFFG